MTTGIKAKSYLTIADERVAEPSEALSLVTKQSVCDVLMAHTRIFQDKTLNLLGKIVAIVFIQVKSIKY